MCSPGERRCRRGFKSIKSIEIVNKESTNEPCRTGKIYVVDIP
jgi:hypothetical protein